MLENAGDFRGGELYGFHVAEGLSSPSTSTPDPPFVVCLCLFNKFSLCNSCKAYIILFFHWEGLVHTSRRSYECEEATSQEPSQSLTGLSLMFRNISRYTLGSLDAVNLDLVYQIWPWAYNNNQLMNLNFLCRVRSVRWQSPPSMSCQYYTVQYGIIQYSI